MSSWLEKQRRLFTGSVQWALLERKRKKLYRRLGERTYRLLNRRQLSQEALQGLQQELQALDESSQAKIEELRELILHP